MESEIKLSFESVEKLYAITNTEWFAHLCLDSSYKAPELLKNTYYDSADRKLTQRHGSIRVRLYTNEEGNERYEHTVKFGGSVLNGLHQRYEWNLDTDSDKFNKTAFIKNAIEEDDPNELLENFLEDVDDDDIVPIVSTEFRRTKYTVGYGDSMMEACLDEGTITAGEKSVDICELELELLSGDIVDLKELGEYFLDNTDAVLFNDSKFKRGIKLLDEE